jgi:hypothetical protein
VTARCSASKECVAKAAASGADSNSM